MKSVFIVLVLICNFSFAGICDVEMQKFNVSAEKQKQICRFFSDSDSFKEFRDCVFSTSKKYDKSTTDKDIYSSSEKELGGVLSLCSGGVIGASPAAAKQEKKNTAPNAR